MTNIMWLEQLEDDAKTKDTAKLLEYIYKTEPEWCKTEHDPVDSPLVTNLLEAIAREMLRANEAEKKLETITRLLQK